MKEQNNKGSYMHLVKIFVNNYDAEKIIIIDNICPLKKKFSREKFIYIKLLATNLLIKLQKSKKSSCLHIL